MKFIALLLTLALFAACNAAPVAEKPAAVLPQPTPVVVVPTPTPKMTPPPMPGTIDDVMAIATGSACAKAAHGAQGTPPKSYMKGIALSFARAACNPDREAVKVAGQAIGDASKDALAHYGIKADTPDKRLAAVYALMVGSAARESSWRWCVGKDPGADNTDSETCEAGLYQTSYNSRTRHAVLPKLYAQFKADKSGCFESTYKSTTTCSEYNLKNWGTGEGVEFQRLTKNCPGFASEYHAVMLRVNRTHYGPINRKMVTYVPACADMFAQVGAYVKAHPGVCRGL